MASPTYNAHDHIYYFDTTAEITAAQAVTLGKTAKAIAFDALNVVYISNGTTWQTM